ncbi:unnamed protein product [Ilex paraguariensis]|uniref:Uncharacterized protein n=1 Tax=Ilex paraguariensis TaxID=185542 RepID=A0ABC8SL12_9AQUA
MPSIGVSTSAFSIARAKMKLPVWRRKFSTTPASSASASVPVTSFVPATSCIPTPTPSHMKWRPPTPSSTTWRPPTPSSYATSTSWRPPTPTSSSTSWRPPTQ